MTLTGPFIGPFSHSNIVLLHQQIQRLSNQCRFIEIHAKDYLPVRPQYLQSPRPVFTDMSRYFDQVFIGLRLVGFFLLVRERKPFVHFFISVRGVQRRLALVEACRRPEPSEAGTLDTVS
jgi:hypothetical protein